MSSGRLRLIAGLLLSLLLHGALLWQGLAPDIARPGTGQAEAHRLQVVWVEAPTPAPSPAPAAARPGPAPAPASPPTRRPDTAAVAPPSRQGAGAAKATEQAATAAAPQAPVPADTEAAPDAARSARDKVLQRMVDLGVWSRAEVDDARIEPVVARSLQAPLSAALLAVCSA